MFMILMRVTNIWNYDVPIMGFERAAATGITPTTILMSPNDSPISLACKVTNG